MYETSRSIHSTFYFFDSTKNKCVSKTTVLHNQIGSQIPLVTIDYCGKNEENSYFITGLCVTMVGGDWVIFDAMVVLLKLSTLVY